MKKSIFIALFLFASIMPQSIKAFAYPFYLSGFYLNANLSCNIATHDKHHHIKASYDPGLFISSAIGHRFCNGLRLEGEFGYRRNNLRRINNFGTSFRMHGDLRTYSALANLYYDFSSVLCLKPYVGFGGGYAYTKNKMNHGYIFRGKRQHDGFAWQVTAGMAYPVNYNLDLAIEYRFFRNVDISHVQNHAVGADVRYYF